MALREYVPGNLIYANGNRFVARRFHRDVDEHRIEMPLFEVSTERQAVKETSAARAPGSPGAAILPAIAVCDVDLTHQSHISDDEELRFQMGVAVYGYERDRAQRRTCVSMGRAGLAPSSGSAAASGERRLYGRDSARTGFRLSRMHRLWTERLATVVRSTVGTLRGRSHLKRCGRKPSARRLLRRRCG